MKLNFYKRPFKNVLNYGSVFDSNNNHIFDFESGFDQSIYDKIIEFLNGEENSTQNKFRKHPDDDIMIQIQGDDEMWYDIILIRGWGNLTGAGGYAFEEKKAIEIQDNLRDYILWKLNK